MRTSNQMSNHSIPIAMRINWSLLNGFEGILGEEFFALSLGLQFSKWAVIPVNHIVTIVITFIKLLAKSP